MKSAAFWLDFTDVLKIISDGLGHDWPAELPPESESQTEAFWLAACREEMRTRQTLSAKIQEILKMQGLPPMTPIEQWLLRRRIEWASQVGMSKFEQDILPPVPLPEVLEWALAKTWESDGCQGLWMHAERAGKMHPEAPDWIRGLE